MAWIESHQSLATHRKTMLLEEALGITTPEAIGHLHLLWWWALDNAPTGSLEGIPDGVIARAAQWDTTDASTFVEAMQFAGFVDKETRTIHDWSKYAGRLITKREANAERMREQRATHVPDTTVARTGATVPNPTVPNPTVPNPTVPNSTLRTTEHFASFWSVYPKRKSKGQAEKAFKRINPDEQLLATMLATIERAKKSDDWLKESGKYIPYPATWLNARGWEDELAVPNSTQNRKALPSDDELSRKARSMGLEDG